MSSKLPITAAPIVDFATERRKSTTWSESVVNPLALGQGRRVKSSSKVHWSIPSGQVRDPWWRRHIRALTAASAIAVALVILVAVLTGVRDQSSSPLSPQQGTDGPGSKDVFGLAGGEGATPLPTATNYPTASPFFAVASLSASASSFPSQTAAVSSAVSLAPTASPLATVTSSVSASVTATPSPLPSLVVVSSNASVVETWSARMLSERLHLPLQLLHTGVPPNTTQLAIAVGFEAAVWYGVDPQQLRVLGADAFLVTNKASRGLSGGSVAVASAASSARGTLNGVYRLLRELGFEFYSLNATRIPPQPFTLPHTGVDVVVEPILYLRDISSGTVQDNRIRIRPANALPYFRPVNLSAALGLNGANANVPVGAIEGASEYVPPGFDATAYVLLSPILNSDADNCAGPDFPPEKHEHNTPCPQVVRQHPEWFACKNGTVAMWPCTNVTLASVVYNTQPCWSVPSLQTAMADSIRTIMRLYPDTRIVSIDNMDGADTICSHDDYLNGVENVTGGANFHAVNNIAANVSAEFPGLTIQTLAYNGAQAPPQHLKFRDNVQVRFVPSINNFQSLYHPSNAVILAEAQAWQLAAKALTVWENCDSFSFTIAPWPNYVMLAQHIIEFARLGYVGYYAAGIPLLGADMADLKTFVTARTLWDPLNANTTALVADFTDFVYGPASAPGVRTYLTTMAASFQSNDKSLDYTGKKGVRGASRRITPWNAVYANRTLISCGAALKAAEVAATSVTYRANVQQAMLSVQYVVLLRWAQLHNFSSYSNIPWPFEATAAAEFQLFNTTFIRTKVMSFLHMDEYPAIASYSCDLACFRVLVLGH